MVQGELLLLLATHLALTALPGVAAALFVAGRGERRIPILLVVALVASGVGGLLGFWAYYAWLSGGQTFSYLLAFGSVLLTGWLLWEQKIPGSVLRGLATPLALWMLGSVFLVFLGFIHGGAQAPLGTAATRFSQQLPSDNDIPLFFAEWFYAHGHGGTPAVFPGEWLASDRPPLQVGYLLSQQPFAFNTAELNYEVLGVCLQQLWIVGLWALLLAAGVGRRTKALAMITVLVSDLAIVNGFFVWPKMLPAALLLAAAALILTPLWEEVRGKLWAGAMIAALFGLAMMGHGSSVFAIVPLAILAVFRGLPSWRWLGVALGVFVLVMVPWSAYQSYGDPPGNRLVKWQIGGVIEIDERGTLETIEDSYREAGVGGMLHNKAENFVVVGGGGPFVDYVSHAVSAIGDGDWGNAVQEMRWALFYYLLPSLGLLLLGPIAMLIGRKRRRSRDRPAEWKLAREALIVTAIGIVFWCLLMFGNGASRAVVHQGSYLLPVLGMVAGICGLRAVWPRAGAWIVGIWAVFMLALYVPYSPAPEGTIFSFFSALIVAVCLVGFGLVAFGRERSRDGDDAARAALEPRPAVAIDSPA
jgi:hypothetical protein